VTDKLTGQKFERYVAEVNETGNEKLKDSAENDEEYDDDETFDDAFPEDEKITTYENFPKAAEEELMDTSSTRWLMYDGLGKLLVSKGLEGRPCVLRAICEAAETPFTHYSGLFGEIFHIIFT
jgi:DM4/DM12 family